MESGKDLPERISLASKFFRLSPRHEFLEIAFSDILEIKKLPNFPAIGERFFR